MGRWRNEFEAGVQIVAVVKALREDVQKELEKQGRPPVKRGNWHLNVKSEANTGAGIQKRKLKWKFPFIAFWEFSFLMRNL